MSVLSPLVEYLLAYERKDGGGKLCTFGASSAIVWFPPNFTITYQVSPPTGIYANILYYYRETPSLVPEAMQQDSMANGIDVSLGPITTVMMDSEAGGWTVIRADNPTITTVTNRTNLMQREDYAQQYLVVHSEEDYREIMLLIRDWCTNFRVSYEIEKLTALAKPFLDIFAGGG